MRTRSILASKNKFYILIKMLSDWQSIYFYFWFSQVSAPRNCFLFLFYIRVKFFWFEILFFCFWIILCSWNLTFLFKRNSFDKEKYSVFLCLVFYFIHFCSFYLFIYCSFCSDCIVCFLKKKKSWNVLLKEFWLSSDWKD